MSEFTCVLRSHPFLSSLLLLCISPAFISLLVLFSPLLVTFLLFTLGIAGLARSRRKLGRHRSRRSHKYRNGDCLTWGPYRGFLGGGWVVSGNDGLEGEKQTRVNEYLEDQLKNLEALKGAAISDGVVVGGWDTDDEWPFDPETEKVEDGRCVRSDVSEVGDSEVSFDDARETESITGLRAA